MIRRLAAVAAVLGLAAVALLAGATPAHAACPQALNLGIGATWGNEFIFTNTAVVRCDNGTPSTAGDDYYRLQSWRYDDSSDIRRSYGWDGVGNPIMEWRTTSGVLINKINGLSEWTDGRTVTLGGQKCPTTECRLTVVGRADRIAWPDSNYSNSLVR